MYDTIVCHSVGAVLNAGDGCDTDGDDPDSILCNCDRPDAILCAGDGPGHTALSTLASAAYAEHTIFLRGPR